MAYTQDNRPLRIATPLGDDVLLLRSFTGTEGISQLFAFELEVWSERENLNLADLVGKNITVSMECEDEKPRYWNGIVSRFAQGGRDRYLTAYHIRMSPWPWLLTRRADCRIFQDLSVEGIIQKVFSNIGLTDYKFRLQGSLTRREYCVQYRETDFNFISRLMEEEGIFYFFEHENGKHTLVMADDPAEHKPCPIQRTFRYDVPVGQWPLDSVIEWRAEERYRSGAYSIDDFNFEMPATDLNVAVGSFNPFEVYDYPGLYKNMGEGNSRVAIRLQEERVSQRIINGAGTARSFSSGYKFELADHYRADQNGEYTLTSIKHSAVQAHYHAEGGPDDVEFHYTNSFECIPAAVPYRPARLTMKPFVQGSQTAVVVGTPGEEIYTDKYGRVKVQFHWDRLGQVDERSSCWIRVAQMIAGSHWGSVFLPRIGQEVVVDFLEGDPDRPLITGSVYNAEHMPPYTLPDEKTKSTIKTYSSKGGGGYNEFRIEDKKGSEQIFFNAERNFDLRVKNDRFETIGNESHLIVKKDLLEMVDADHHVTVKGDQMQKVNGTVSLKAGMDMQEKVGMKYALEAGTEVHVKSGMNMVLESGVQLTLKGAGGFINIGPAGVIIQGNMVLINSGGAAGSGAGSNPDLPTAPKEADTAKPGEMKAPKPPKPPKPATYSPAATVMKNSAQNGTPFCEICARMAEGQQ